MIRSDEGEQRRTDRLNVQGPRTGHRLCKASRAAPKYFSGQTPSLRHDLPQSLDRFGIPQADARRRAIARLALVDREAEFRKLRRKIRRRGGKAGAMTQWSKCCAFRQAAISWASEPRSRLSHLR